MARKHNACTLCLKVEGHKPKDCKTDYRKCQKCGEKHIFNLRSQKEKIDYFKAKKEKSKTDSDLTDESSESDRQLNHDTKSRSDVKPRIPNETIHINFSKNNKASKIILHTASATIKGQNVSVLLDPGADATIITKRYAEKINLNPKLSNQVLNIQLSMANLKPHLN